MHSLIKILLLRSRYIAPIHSLQNTEAVLLSDVLAGNQVLPHEGRAPVAQNTQKSAARGCPCSSNATNLNCK
jgi:hypothetical protein